MLDGASRRFAREPPKPDPISMERFRVFVARWLKENMTPLGADADTSFETWITNAPYPLWKKNAFRKVYYEHAGVITPENIVTVKTFRGKSKKSINRYCKVNSFQKDEVYPTYKAARAINSRTDEFKIRVGPIFKLIEKQLFALPYFIKHTPVDERINEIKRELFQDCCKIIGTDYTAFEALFTKLLMDTVEFQLYRYMTTEIEDQDWYEIVTKTLSGENHCQFRDKFTMVVDATRMSGEMCTSLGNSFTNLMCMLFVAQEIGIDKDTIKGRVEGDDGIFTFYGPTPTTADFAKIGMIIKIDEYETLTEGSFCGIIADMDEMINVTDPISSLLDFGWTTKQYAHANLKKRKGLLKAKALSLAYQYPGCPILSSLAQYGLRVSGEKFYVKNLNEYEREIFQQMHEKYMGKVPHKAVGFKTRLLVEKRFGLSVQDQLSIETYLDNKKDLSPIYHPAILSNCHLDTIDYYNKYVFEYHEKADHITDPIHDNYSQERLTLLRLYDNKYEQPTTTTTRKPPTTYTKKIKENGTGTGANYKNS